jgi:flagellar protein FliS
MNHHQAADAYKSAAIENAPPLKIVRLLYAGAIRFLDQALAADAHDPRSIFVDRVHRADRIVSELRLALAHEHGSDVAHDLEQLYLFVEDRLAKAAVSRSAQWLREARLVLERLQSAWNHIGQTDDALSAAR